MIEEVCAKRADTPTGHLPRIRDGFGRGAAWIYSPVRMRVVEVLKSGQERPAGFVVPMWGGSFRDVESTTDPPHVEFEQGQEGIAFLWSVPSGLWEEPWHVTLMRGAKDLSLGGGTRVVMQAWTWYVIDGEKARSQSPFESLSVEALYEAVRAAARTPSAR